MKIKNENLQAKLTLIAMTTSIATYTQVLVEVLEHMNGDAKDAVISILLRSLKVTNVPIGTSMEIAELFTKWHNESVLNERIVCIEPRDTYAALAKAKIEEHLQDLEANIDEYGAMYVDDTSESLHDMYLWVENPILYLEQRNINVRA